MKVCNFQRFVPLKLCEFLTVWVDQAFFGSTENVCNSTEVSYFWGVFSWTKQVQN